MAEWQRAPLKSHSSRAIETNAAQICSVVQEKWWTGKCPELETKRIDKTKEQTEFLRDVFRSTPPYLCPSTIVQVVVLSQRRHRASEKAE